MESEVTVEVGHTDEIKQKQKYTGKVSKISLAGALIDIGAERPAVLHISQIVVENSTEAIKRVEDVLKIGQEIEVWVRKVKEDHIELTMVKPLDLEWREIKSGMAVKGTVTRLEKFGAFIEIGAERPGLVHISEMAHGYVKTPGDVLKEGDEVDAMILEVNRRKKQIKLSLKALQPEPEEIATEVVAEKIDDNQPREKGRPRGKKVGRKEKSKGDFGGDFSLAELAPSEPDPTAMELAWQAAMDKAKDRRSIERNKKSRSSSNEIEEIITRTLEHKVQHN